MGNMWDNTKQCQYRKVREAVSAADAASGLAGANRTNAYFLANLKSSACLLQVFTGGFFLAVDAAANDGPTCTFELWGYARGGTAEFLGEYTFTGGTEINDDSRYWCDTITVVEDAEPALSKQEDDGDNRKSLLKGDSVGYQYIVVYVKAVSASNFSFHLRPWG